MLNVDCTSKVLPPGFFRVVRTLDHEEFIERSAPALDRCVGRTNRFAMGKANSYYPWINSYPPGSIVLVYAECRLMEKLDDPKVALCKEVLVFAPRSEVSPPVEEFADFDELALAGRLP